MSDQHPPNTKQPAVAHHHLWANIGIAISASAVVLMIVALGWGYFALAKVTMRLAMTMAAVNTQTTTTQHQLASQQQNIGDLQQAMQQSQALLSQQQQTLSNWQTKQQGDIDQWHVAEARYLVALAQNHVQFTHDVATALVLLQQADKALQTIPDAKSLDLRKALALDLARLQALPAIDTTALYLRLAALDDQIKQLSLVLAPLTSASSSGALNAKANAAKASDLPWWQASVENTLHALSQIVIVRKTDPNVLPLVLPEEKAYLQQTLHAQIENAQWGLLHRQAEIYQISLKNAATWIKQYFVPNAQATQSALQTIAELQKWDLQPQSVDLTNTLKLFDDYLSGPRSF